MRLWAVVLLIALAVMVWGGMKLVSQLGLFFAAVVGLTLTSYYAGLIAAPLPGTSSAVTGLSSQTLKDNWDPPTPTTSRSPLCCPSSFRASPGSWGREQGERSEGSCKVDPLGHPHGDHAELLHVRKLHDNVGRGRG